MLHPFLLAVCSGVRERAPAILQPVEARGSCAIVFSLHKATVCELSRFEHAVRTRPQRCDVVALYNAKGLATPPRQRMSQQPWRARDATLDGFLNGTHSMRTRAIGVHVVPYDDGETMAALLREGYSSDALRMFSPSRSRLSKVVWFVWGARQTFRSFWFAEADVLMPSSWSALVDAVPLEARRTPGSAREERLACAIQAGGKAAPGLGRWFWAQASQCTFCERLAPVIRGCLLALSGLSQGLVRAVNGRLLAGRMRGHHEVLVPTACAIMGRQSHGRRSCAMTVVQRERGVFMAMRSHAAMFSRDEACRLRAAARAEHAAIVRAQRLANASAKIARASAGVDDLADRRCEALQGAASRRRPRRGGPAHGTRAAQPRRPNDVSACGGAKACAFHPAKCSRGEFAYAPLGA